MKVYIYFFPMVFPLPSYREHHSISCSGVLGTEKKKVLLILYLIQITVEKKETKQYIYIYTHIYIYTILPKVLGHPLLMNRFDNFSNFHEYKS